MLEPLEEHNERMIKSHYISNTTCPNNLACPKCGEELLDSDQSISLTSWPAKKSIHCLKCDFKGYRVL